MLVSSLRCLQKINLSLGYVLKKRQISAMFVIGYKESNAQIAPLPHEECPHFGNWGNVQSFPILKGRALLCLEISKNMQ